MSLRVAARLAADGIGARVLDLRWLARCRSTICSARRTRPAGCRRRRDPAHGGVGEGVVTALVENGYTGAIARVASRDSYIPIGDAANLVMLSEDDIEHTARLLVE